MKVNMTPNPLDVVTIHASQGDTEARQWEFELHNNGELIDTSDITEQLFFKAYKGGTEQILPENGSTPTTSPFLGDIKYPQGLLNDQEFTYRQSPTEEDGLAKITDIKGNTLVWNQLVQNGNFDDTSGWSSGGNRGTLSASNNELSYTITEIGTSTELNRIQRSASFTQNHIYLLMFDFYALRNGTMRGILGGSQNVRGRQIPCVSGWNKYADILTANSTNTTVQGCFSAQTDYSVGEVVKWRKFMLIDLTQMGLDISSPSDFTSLFPLSYYSYNQGSLLSFNGNGIKTVGKNLFDQNSVLLSQGFVKQNDGSYYKDNLAPLSNAIVWNNDAHISGAINIKYQYKYTNGTGSSGLRPLIRYTDGTEKYNYPTLATDFTSFSLQTDPTKTVDKIVWDYGSSFNGTYIKDFIISIDNISYEPYTSSTLSLPISTYFSNGMKSAGNVYDELTESKAITRIGSVDLGSLNWTYQSSSGNMYVDNVVSNRKNNLGFNAICSKYQQVNEDTISGVASLIQDKSFAFQYSFNGRIIVRDTSYTDATVFKQAMADQNVKLYYELATPTETSFTTASLVTENAEIPLSAENDVLVGKCTEELSAQPGFIDAKIKLTDGDGTCYSNKIQLHVERKPS